MKDLTIKDIARIAGVSTAAVSFVINDKEGVGQETREKIKKIIEQTGFIPNVHTRRLNFKKSFNVTLAIKQNISTFSNMFYMEILSSILSESKNYEYNLVLSDISDIDHEMKLINNIATNDTDGIIFIQEPSKQLLSKVEERKLPFLVVDPQQPNPDYLTISVDYRAASRTAVEYLISKGHKKIAYIGMKTNLGFYMNTFGGYTEAMKKAEYPIMPDWIQPDAFDEGSSYSCMQRILDSKQIPTAVFCSSDVFAYSSMKCVKDKGLHVPDDMSFFGMDDIQLSKYVQPPLSTMFVDEEYMGKAALQLIDKMIDSEDCESILLSSTTIIERESVKDLSE